MDWFVFLTPLVLLVVASPFLFVGCAPFDAAPGVGTVAGPPRSPILSRGVPSFASSRTNVFSYANVCSMGRAGVPETREIFWYKGALDR